MNNEASDSRSPALPRLLPPAQNGFSTRDRLNGRVTKLTPQEAISINHYQGRNQAMAEYYPERRQVRELFEVPLEEDKIKAMCAGFERWDFVEGIDCKCGNKSTLKLGKAEG
jgi:hypothetical protein